jgi:hypothetical protein
MFAGTEESESTFVVIETGGCGAARAQAFMRYGQVSLPSQNLQQSAIAAADWDDDRPSMGDQVQPSLRHLHESTLHAAILHHRPRDLLSPGLPHSFSKSLNGLVGPPGLEPGTKGIWDMRRLSSGIVGTEAEQEKKAPLTGAFELQLSR